MTHADPTLLELQAAVAGRFSIEREIGRGGMGIVYLARDVQLERPVAIKLLAPAFGAGADMRRRFLREARIAAQCFHPHIVPIHSVEESGSLAWFVMPYVRGETVAERVRRLGPLPPEEVRRLGNEIGWALAYAHQRGVVHRDVKPENILIDAASGRFLIADFGIARGGDDDASSGGRAGTPRYMAPEQAVGDHVDGRADLYALGASLYAAATGRPPFEAPSVMALVALHASSLATPVRDLAPTLPLALADAIDRCLAKRPDDRFANAEAFIEALEPPPSEGATVPALGPLRNNLRGTQTLVRWAGVSGLTTLLLAAGEHPGSFGQGIILSIGGWFSAAFAFAAAVRGVETVLSARRALRAGHGADDVTRALAAGDPALAAPAEARGVHVAVALTGVALALAQGWLTSASWMPGLLTPMLQPFLIFAPAFLISRGIAGALPGTGLSRWLRQNIGMPAVRLISRIAGRGIPPVEHAALLPANAATEVLLDRAVQREIELLPAPARAAVADAGALASSLARKAEALRAEDAKLAGEERAARHATDPGGAEQELARIVEARRAVRERLGTTIAALEQVRLSVLRLAAEPVTVSGLTTQLEAVRELERRIDANVEVKALLDGRLPEGGGSASA